MLWVGLATLIMLITGSGDDTRQFRKRARAFEERITDVIHDEQRRATVLQALAETSDVFWDHRVRLDAIGRCLAKLDADYHATRSEYEGCYRDSAQVWSTAASDFITKERKFRNTLSPHEWSQIQEVMTP